MKAVTSERIEIYRKTRDCSLIEAKKALEKEEALIDIRNAVTVADLKDVLYYLVTK